MHKIFSFKGITRNGDPLVADEGECIKVVNMRMKDGVYVPVPRPEVVAELDYAYYRIFRHEATGCYLCLTDNADRVLHIYDNEWKLQRGSDGKILFEELHGVRGVEFLGFVACCLTDRGVFYILYSDGCYMWLGERPPMPSLDITISSRLVHTVTENSFYPSATEGIEATWQYNSKGYFDEAIAGLNDTGYYIDRALFKFALRLYDGSYISISPAMYVSDDNVIDNVSRDGYNLIASTADDSYPSRYNVKVLGFKPTFAFSDIRLQNWKNIVVGIDLFTTGSIMGKKVGCVRRSVRNGSNGSTKVEYDVYKEKGIDELCSDISSAAHYFRIAEYDIDGRLVDSLNDVSQVNLVLQPSLANDECTYSSLAPQCSYMFNSRLHIAAFKEWFMKGYDAGFLKNACGDRAVLQRLVIKTWIKTMHGISTVVREYNGVELPYNNGCFELSPLLSYPDTRAYEMSVYVDDGSGFVYKNFALTPHRYLNQSQYLNCSLMGLKVSYRAELSNGSTVASLRDIDVAGMFLNVAGVHEVIYSQSAGTWLYRNAPFPTGKYSSFSLVKNISDLRDGDRIVFTVTMTSGTGDSGDICNIPVDETWERAGEGVDFSEDTPFEVRENVLRVSAVENPFVFPAKCTYTPSQGGINALASNTVELSQGQFGQHPLFVFCSDGIWAMSVDASGTVAYLGSYPLSREVCVNPASVCCVDGGVVFVGQQGLMIISGGRLKNLSACMDGETDQCGLILSNRVIGNIISMMQLPAGGGCSNFTGYIATATVGYQPSHNELLITNGDAGYSYICSLKGGTWSSADITADGFIKGGNGFGLFMNSGGKCVIMRVDNSYSGSNRVFLLTRPQLWGTKLPKRVMQLMLHAYAHPVENRSLGLPSLACYMFGSNDGVHFGLLAGRECEDEVQDIKFPYFPTQSYKYYIFAVCGELSSQSRITGLEIEMQYAWKNRFR